MIKGAIKSNCFCYFSKAFHHTGQSRGTACANHITKLPRIHIHRQIQQDRQSVQLGSFLHEAPIFTAGGLFPELGHAKIPRDAEEKRNRDSADDMHQYKIRRFPHRLQGPGVDGGHQKGSHHPKFINPQHSYFPPAAVLRIQPLLQLSLPAGSAPSPRIPAPPVPACWDTGCAACSREWC